MRAVTTFSEVLDLAQSTAEALDALDDTSDARVLSFFARLENGLMTVAELRSELLKQARAGFVTAGSLAYESVKVVADRESLPPLTLPPLRDAPVLQHVLLDLQKNVTAYAESERTEKDFRRLRFRARLGVQTALRRGFAENQIAASRELQAHGASLRKIWLANFKNNAPCSTCMELHGTEVSLAEDFPHGDAHSPSVFLGLQGPPRHPNCRCYMLVYVTTLESTIKSPDTVPGVSDQYMNSRDVRKLPRSVYTAVVTTMRIIAGKLKGAIYGKR